MFCDDDRDTNLSRLGHYMPVNCPEEVHSQCVLFRQHREGADQVIPFFNLEQTRLQLIFDVHPSKAKIPRSRYRCRQRIAFLRKLRGTS